MLWNNRKKPGGVGNISSSSVFITLSNIKVSHLYELECCGPELQALLQGLF